MRHPGSRIRFGSLWWVAFLCFWPAAAGGCRCDRPRSVRPDPSPSRRFFPSVCLVGFDEPWLFRTVLKFSGATSCGRKGWVVRAVPGGMLLDGHRVNVFGRVSRIRTLLRWVRRRLGHRRQPLWPGAKWSRTDLESAWLGGMAWLGERVQRADLGELSDLIQAFAIYRRSAASAVVRAVARRFLRRAADRYADAWRRHADFNTVEDFFDAVSAFFYLGRMGMAPRGMGRKLRRARLRWRDGDLLRSKEGLWDQSATRLLDTLVDLYFVDALGMSVPVPYKSVVQRALSWPLRLSLAADPETFEAQTYLATHLVYVLSRFETTRVPALYRRRLLSYLRGAARFYLQVGDIETLGEIIDCMKILGASYESRVVRRSVGLFLKAQHQAGDWGTTSDSYSRYHTTWTVLSGLMDYDLTRKARLRSVPARRQRRDKMPSSSLTAATVDAATVAGRPKPIAAFGRGTRR